MKNYIDLVGKEIVFINEVVESYNKLLKKEVLTLGNAFDNFYLNLIKENENYKNYKITRSASDNGYMNNYMIYSSKSIKNEEIKSKNFELSELEIVMTEENEVSIKHISLSKYIKEDSIMLTYSIKEKNINITITYEKENSFALSKISIDNNNKFKITNLIDEMPKSKNFRSAYYIINKLQEVENPENIIDYLLIDKEIKEEDLNLYLLAFDFDFRDAANNPLKLNLEIKNKLLVNNRTVKIK